MDYKEITGNKDEHVINQERLSVEDLPLKELGITPSVVNRDLWLNLQGVQNINNNGFKDIYTPRSQLLKNK